VLKEYSFWNIRSGAMMIRPKSTNNEKKQLKKLWNGSRNDSQN
jgi:hypothetical protein